ncbi:MAG TPA: DPP IV N-terminal domain-containing protein, partial [Candidatus Krumholzibacteria bacterium]|nr:DPP IV N-terminal domain-containing protein [Candidatus Krumholzibacteria bacterium]
GYVARTPELWLRDTDSGDVRRVLPPDSVVMDPAPSPDGTRIAFVIADYFQNTGDIFVMDHDGANFQQITFDSELDDQPSWSPDGTRIAFRSWQAGYLGDIWVMDADGGNQVRLTFDPLPGVWDESHPAWSPDGTRIAYAGNAGGNYDIWTMAIDGSDSLQITNDEDFETEPAWSPDGSVIVFRRCDNVEGCDLFLIAAGGGAVLPIPRAGEQRMPVFTPDGARIVFVDQETGFHSPDLFSIRPDGTGAAPLVTDELPGGSLNPAFLRRRSR